MDSALIDPKLLEATAKELLEHAEGALGVFLDAQRGWRTQHLELEKLANLSVEKLGYTREKALSVVMAHCVTGRDGKEIALHESTVSQTLERTKPLGFNDTFLANMCVVSLYDFWDARTRKLFAQAFGLDHSKINSDLFGDLRALRHAVLHCGGVADSRVGKCKTLKWFKVGDAIQITGPKLHLIIEHVRDLCDAMISYANDRCPISRQGIIRKVILPGDDIDR